MAAPLSMVRVENPYFKTVSCRVPSVSTGFPLWKAPLQTDQTQDACKRQTGHSSETGRLIRDPQLVA